MRKLSRWQWGLIGIIGLTALGTLTAPPKDRTRVDLPTISPPEVRELRDDGFYAVVVDRRTDGRSLPEFARNLCGARPYCNVTGWTDKTRVARGYPFTDREAAAIAFSYTVNRRNGDESIYWDCKIWTQPDATTCIE